MIIVVGIKKKKFINFHPVSLERFYETGTKIGAKLTFAIVCSSGSSWGSAQSTMISQPQTLMRPVLSRRLANEADL